MLAGRESQMNKPKWALLFGLALVTASILLSIAWKIRIVRYNRLARQTVEELELALSEFYAEHRAWPLDVALPLEGVWGSDVHPNRHILRVLVGQVAVPGASEAVPWLQFPSWQPGRSGLSPESDLLDPWGNPYQIVLNENVRALNAQDIQRVIRVWSLGFDGISNTRDDIALRSAPVEFRPKKFVKRPGR
jgi:hypothetical protein